MVTAMYLAMAVGTVLSDEETIAARVATVVIQKITDMVAATDTRLGDMALLAQLGAGFVQQRHMVRTMNTMTQGTVFTDRLMLPQERATFFSMAAIAVLVDGELIQ
jgi:hypothetical protein